MYTFKPVLKQTIWGGESIAPFKGIQTDLHTIGESWEISALPGSESVVADGADAGHQPEGRNRVAPDLGLSPEDAQPRHQEL